MGCPHRTQLELRVEKSVLGKAHVRQAGFLAWEAQGMSEFKAARPTGIQRLQGWKTEPSRKGGLADCTLVVATYKRPGRMLELLKCLDGLFDTPGEVVIVDGSPGRGTENTVLEWVKARHLRFEPPYLSPAPGLSRQPNAGVDASTWEYRFFRDDDGLPRR